MGESMAVLKIVKPATEAERTTRTTMDTIEITPSIVRSWKTPPFQRPLRVSAKVMEISSEIADNDGVVPGIVTIGVLGADRYVVDGQHRLEAFLQSNCTVGYLDVRFVHHGDMADMAEEFYKLNSRIVSMRPDDYLRALESSSELLRKVRKRCPFVGYDMIRRGDHSPILSASVALRCWWTSGREVPQGGGASLMTIVKEYQTEEADSIIGFLEVAHAAWGRDYEYARLWGSLNLTLCMWLYRRLVMSAYSTKTQRVTKEMFQKCLMALSADATFLDWLLGRKLTDRDRSPAYGRIKNLFAKRLEAETGKRPLLPAPAWAAGQRGGK